MQSIPASILAALLLCAGPHPAAEDPSEPAPNAGLRGAGILILDQRDPPDLVKKKLRQFLDQLQPHVPEEYRREENRRQIGALLEADWKPGEDLPQLDLTFHPDVTVAMIRAFVEATGIGTDSGVVCPAACPLRGIRSDVIHVHLTRGEPGAGDTILAFYFWKAGAGPGGKPLTAEARANRAYEIGESFFRDYSRYGYERKPVGKVFGLGVVVGEQRVPPDWMAPEKGP